MDSRFANQSHSGGFNYLPETEENGPLAGFNLGDIIHKTVRIMTCIYKGDQGFAVYDVEEDERRFVITGAFPYDLMLNGFYLIKGEVTLDKRGNRQIKVQTCESTLPKDKNGILTVLRTLHGLDTQAHKLYSIVGPDILDILKNEPQKVVAMVKGVGIKRAKAWQKELLDRSADDEELKRLYALGLNQKQATKLISEHGLEICKKVEDNPYLLRGKIRGYSFKKCDKLALDSGYSVKHPDRIKEGLLYVLSAVEERGHCTYPKETFLQSAYELLDVSIGMKASMQLLKGQNTGSFMRGTWGKETYLISTDDLNAELSNWNAIPHGKNEKFRYVLDRIDPDLIDNALRFLQSNGSLAAETTGGKEYITPNVFYQAECEIAADVRDFIASERMQFSQKDEVIARVLNKKNVILETKQMEAVQRICNAEGGIFILNGSAGCGKTFTLDIIMDVLRELYDIERSVSFNPCILAPTGKAAKVAERVTHLPARTIHRALGLISSDSPLITSGKNSDIHNNCIVVDEFSMVDELLCAQLFQGIPKASKIILLGDTQQLPSIRAGRVLKDLIESGVVPVITLDVVKRQDAQSGVLLNANKIINGLDIMDEITNDKGMKGNAYVKPCLDPYKAQSIVIKMAKNCGLKAFQDGQVQVLCPLKSGPTGTGELNYCLQQALNPHIDGQEVIIGKLFLQTPDGGQEAVNEVFRVGDCVIHTKNNYNQPWFEKHPVNGFIETRKSGVVNGDTGIIDSIVVYKDGANVTHQVLYVNYDGHYIQYDNDYEELSLAYALTIHKSQGSQWPTVICPIMQRSFILNRKLLYTMYTRAQDCSVLIGRDDLIHAAIQDNREDYRMTLLQQRLTRQVW